MHKNLEVDARRILNGSEEDLFEQQLSRMVNTMNNEPTLNAIAYLMQRDHRTLVQTKFSLCLRFIYMLADNFDEDRYDARNEYACKTSKAIVNLLGPDAFRVPFI